MVRLSKSLLFFWLLGLGLSACSGPSDQEATALALGQSIAMTATAAAGDAFDSGANLLTAQAEATNSALNISMSQTAEAGLSEEARAATATAVAPILAELPTYGVDPGEGHVAWIHPPETLQIEGYLQFDYANRFIGTIATDFVVSADITWNTSYGSSGCGFVLRSDGNKDALSQYIAIATRGGNGRVIFSSMDKGAVKNVIDNYAYGIDPLFDWRNETTNRITIVARDDLFRIYTNGTYIGEVTTGKPPVLVLPLAPAQPAADASDEELSAFDKELEEYDDIVAQAKQKFQQNLVIFQQDTPYFERGFVAMVALSESGTTICSFDNAWLFIMK